MRQVAIIDYRLCNIDSIRRAVELCGATVETARDPGAVRAAAKLVLPGVGSFRQAMANLREAGLVDAIRDAVGGGTPLLGICLGMQLLASRGSEGGTVEGLSLIPGSVERLDPRGSDERLPHMGWNAVDHDRGDPLLNSIDSGRDFYFVHSYHLRCERAESVLATTPYCGGFSSVVRNHRVWGTQFHPEKSQAVGMQLLRNFLTHA